MEINSDSESYVSSDSRWMRCPGKVSHVWACCGRVEMNTWIAGERKYRRSLKVGQQDMIINWNISNWREKQFFCKLPLNVLPSYRVMTSAIKRKRRIQILLRPKFQQGTASDRFSNSYKGKKLVFTLFRNVKFVVFPRVRASVRVCVWVNPKMGRRICVRNHSKKHFCSEQILLLQYMRRHTLK